MQRLKRIISYIPASCRVIYCVFAASVLLHTGFLMSERFAELYCGSVGAFFRSVLAWATNIFPMSLSETLLLFSPFILVSLILAAVRTKGDAVQSVRLVSGITAVLTAVYSLFVLTFASGFYVRDIGEYFGIERRDITVDELYSAAIKTAEGANEAAVEIGIDFLSSSVMDMSYDEMSRKLVEAYGRISERYGYPSKLKSRVKPIVLSEPMTYTHISGIYTFFTGEANININFPDFTIPYTAAHELSHQRGISREDEANFTAFLVCLESDDPYIRYSGYLNMYQYMASALYSVSPEKYRELYYSLDEGIREELSAYSSFFDQYRENKAANISTAVNDAYLHVMSGTDSRSYGMAVDLAALYLNGK